MPALAFIHTFVRTHVHKYDISSWIGREFVNNILSHLVCSQCIQPKRQSDNQRLRVNIYIIAAG